MTYQDLKRRPRARRLSASICAAAVAAAVAGAGPAVGDSGGVGAAEDPPSSGQGEGRFPVAGKHAYGDGLGAGRGHQGQDLLAKCGKPVVAAQPGRVEVRDYQAAGAGNYVVVDGKGRLPDAVYMHMLRPASVREGQRVSSGDAIGRVGSTGRSTACHLHFEMWSGSGWYSGGRPTDPEPELRRWDGDH